MKNQSSFILQEASAGSGKTFLLVKQFVSILVNTENPDKFKQLLAITFTNKASLEMKERVLKLLQDFSEENFKDNFVLQMIVKESNLSPETIHQRAKNSLTQIIHQYSQFSISTIDKFNLRLMKTFAHDLGLSINFDVEMDQKKLLKESVQMLYNEIGMDEKLTNFLIEAALNQLEEDQKWDFTNDLVSVSQNTSSEQFDGELNRINKISLQEYESYKNELNAFIKSTTQELVNIGNETMCLIEQNGLEIEHFYYGKNGIGAYFNNLQTEDFKFLNLHHQKFINSENLYSTKAKINKKQAIDSIQPILAELAVKANKLFVQLDIKQLILKRLNAQSLLNEINKKLAEIKSQNSVLLMSEFNKKISTYLKNQPAAYIYERLGEKYYHYFLDEFQDTSIMQWENLFPLIENAKASTGSALLVGDVKQSIYRFRGANPETMLHLMQEKELYGLELDNLTTNYRSFSTIIDFNNSLYSFIAKGFENPIYKQIYENAFQNENDKKGGFVQLHCIEKIKGQTTEDFNSLVFEQIENQVKKCREANYEFKDIAILVRDNKEGVKIAEYLSQQKIPVISNESLLLDSCTEIQCIIYYLKWLNNSLDQENLANFCVSLKQLNKIPTTIDFSQFCQTLIALKNPKKIHDYLFEIIQIDLKAIEINADDLFTKIEKIIENLAFDKGKNAYLQSFLDVVFGYASKKESTLSNFLTIWNDKKHKLAISFPADSNAIKILTIHKSKGLEFPVVIIPFADWEGKKNNLWIPTQQEKIPFVFVEKWGSIDNELLQEQIQKEKETVALDDINLLYVATTRAVEKLFIIAKKQIDDKGKIKIQGINGYLIDYLQKNYPSQTSFSVGNFENKTTKKSENQPEKDIPTIYNHWESKITIAHRFKKLYHSKNQKQNYGNLIHLLLAEIYQQQDIDFVVEKYLNMGLIQLTEKEKNKELLLKIVLHIELNDFFVPSNKTIYNERAFINEKGEILIPDKVVITNEKHFIIDYKTGEPNESHLFQLNKYEKLFNNNKIEKILVYLTENEVKIVRV